VFDPRSCRLIPLFSQLPPPLGECVGGFIAGDVVMTGLENVSSSRRSRKAQKFLCFPVRTPSAFLQACRLPEAEMRAEGARMSAKCGREGEKSQKTTKDRESKCVEDVLR
jgi:hypothetical protein